MMVIDAHQHFWNVDKLRYAVLSPDNKVLYRNMEPSELHPLLLQSGVDKTVLVQADNSYEETDYLLKLASQYDWISGVVGWIPLDRPHEAAIKLEEYSKHSKFKGIRHLIMLETDQDWIVQTDVLEGLSVLSSFGLTFDVSAEFPKHLEHIPTIAEKIPNLKIVIDHLAKPPIKQKQIEPWASQMKLAASYPDVYAKISGLNTAADWELWSVADIKPYIDYAFEAFGSERLMFGSDWPVADLAGNYGVVWEATHQALQDRSPAEKAAVFGGTAKKFYNL